MRHEEAWHGMVMSHYHPLRSLFFMETIRSPVRSIEFFRVCHEFSTALTALSTATQPRQTDIDLLPKLGRTWPSLLKCQGNPHSRWCQNDPTWDETPKRIVVHSKKSIQVVFNIVLTAGRKWGVPPPRLSTVARWYGTDTPKRLEKCWMDGDLSKHKLNEWYC